MTHTETDLAYAAGIIDGEGTITIAKRWNKYGVPKYHEIIVSVANTDRRMIEWLDERWPGTLSTFISSNPKHRRRWLWQVNAKRAAAFIREVEPYLVVKRAQALIGLEFRETYGDQPRGRNKLSPGVSEKREQLRDNIRFLNRRGVA